MYLMGNPDSMDDVSILEKIVRENGSCDWANGVVCRSCPLGKSARAAESRPMSCVEALLGTDDLSVVETDARYKRAALEKLADLAIHHLIEET
jgi:hypothetical protein